MGNTATATEAGKRHNASDSALIQQLHDTSVDLGATCSPMDESTPEETSAIGAWVRAMTAESFAALATAVAERTALDEAAKVTKSEGDAGDFPASDYAYVPDASSPSTWKLRLTATPGGDPDAGIVGNAVAALGKGFRGNKVQIPAADLPKVKARVRAAWTKANPDKSADDMPEAIKEADGPTELTGDLVPLVEKAVKRDGTAKIKIIQAGQGSSGFYPAEVLKRDGPRVFAEGTHIYLDHPSASDEANRPERSVRDLAGSLTGPAVWEENGGAGPGLYAPVKFIDSVAPHINAIAPISGMSIRASGRAGTREIDGKKVRTIEGLDVAHSVDVVTRAGAGGKVVDLIESARTGAPPTKPNGGTTVTDDEARELREALTQAQGAIDEVKAENARLSEALLFAETRDFVASELAAIEMPEQTRRRIVAEQSTKPVLTEAGKLDREGMRKQLRAKATEELEYLKTTTGYTGVRGMGGGPAIAPLKESQERIERSMRSLGLSEAGAKLAATGR